MEILSEPLKPDFYMELWRYVFGRAPLAWSSVLIEEREQMGVSPCVIWQLKMLNKYGQLATQLKLRWLWT